jgi:hypothetical protein
MPNWVTNVLTFEGKRAQEVIDFMRSEDEEFDFNNIVPEEWGDSLNWRRKHWGTKWNACQPFVNGNCVSFETAWSHPVPIIEALIERFPDVKIHVKFADEDIGNNLGEYIVQGNTFTYIKDEEKMTEEERMRFACEIKGYDYDELKAEWAE